MIVKSLSRKSGGSQLLRYVLRYTLDEKKQPDAPFFFRHNVRSNTIDGYINEFKENEARRIRTRSDQVLLHHCILSLSDQDQTAVTPQMLKEITKEFIRLRGENNLYIASAHYDKSHVHVHIVISGVKLNGKSSRISQQEFSQLKLSLDAFQQEKYPDLIHSLPEHGRSKMIQQKKPVIDKRDGRTSQKEQLLQTVQAAYENAQSQEAFLEALKSAGHSPYYRTGMLTGITVETGRKFRFRSLGFDAEKLSALTTREYKAKELTALQTIRNRSIEQIKEHKVETEMKPDNVMNELEELRNLRITSSRGARGFIPDR